MDSLDALTNTTYNPTWPDSPNPAYTKIYTNFQTEVNTGLDYYGQQLRTFVVPPTNGNYVFWISSDDTSELFVSSDETPANAAPTAWVSSWTDSMIWTDEPSQQSAPVYPGGGTAVLRGGPASARRGRRQPGGALAVAGRHLRAADDGRQPGGHAADPL